LIISDLSYKQLTKLAAGNGLGLKTGPFTISVRTSIDTILEGIYQLYSDFPLLIDPELVDFSIRIDHSQGLRRFYRPQVIFSLDGRKPFHPLPLSQALPVFEWGLNWCISSQAHQYLILHAAVVEKNAKAIILPAPPGNGKSTLCAGLVSAGWRLLSDEMALLDTKTLQVIALPRPIALKNESIDIISNYHRDFDMGPLSYGTIKGTVGHVRPPVDSVRKQGQASYVYGVVFPEYQASQPAQLTEETKARSFIELVSNSFNYHVLGLNGYHLLGELVSSRRMYRFRYSKLQEAVQVFDDLVS